MANSDPVGALMRGIDILKLIGTSENGMRVCEIASALRLKQPTCYNLVRTLLYTGFVEKRDSRLFLGQELIKMLEKHDQKETVSKMEPELLSLYQRLSRVTVILAVPGMYGVFQTHRISIERPGVIQHLHSEPMHLYASAAGLVYLAFAFDESNLPQINERWPFAEFGAHLWGTRGKLDAYLEKIRKNKFAVSPFDRDVSLRISAPVFTPEGSLAAVIGASVPVQKLQKMDENFICREILASVKKLSALFTARP